MDFSQNPLDRIISPGIIATTKFPSVAQRGGNHSFLNFLKRDSFSGFSVFIFWQELYLIKEDVYGKVEGFWRVYP